MHRLFARLFAVLLTAGLITSLPQTSNAQVSHVLTLADSLVGAVGGITVDRAGLVYSANFGSNVWRIYPDGRKEIFATGLYGASGNTIDRQGHLLQSNFFGNYLSRIDRDGNKEIVAARGLSGPVGVIEHPNGNVYVNNCTSNSVVRVDKDWNVSPLADGDVFRCPNGITVGPDSALYVVNFGDGNMIRITEQGESSLFATIPGGNAGHVVFTRGKFYVTAYQANRIYSVTMDGVVTHETGTGRVQEMDGAAKAASFAFPNGIGLGPTGDRLYVNDFVNRFPPTITQPPVPQHTVRQLMIAGLDDLLRAAFESGGIEAMRKAHVAYKADPYTASIYTEWLMNALGYTLIEQGTLDAAVAVFELNVQDYPNAFNPHDSLGEALLLVGQKENAVRHFRRSLELNPGNLNAADRLKELEEE